MRAARGRLFLGRTTELALFRRALTGEPHASSVLHLHGPGGIGKSVLLHRFAAEAPARGRPVVEVDAGAGPRDPERLEAAASRALTDDRAVLLVDDWEPGGELEHWLWERLLPRLPVGVVAAVAARHAPDPRWIADPGWSGVLHVAPLRALPPDEAAALLAARGVPADRQHEMLAFAGGHPLALTVAAAAAGTGDAGRPAPFLAAAPPRDVVQALLARVVGEVPGATHHRALEVCAQLLLTTEAVLRLVLGDEAGQAFEWLRQLPFVDSGRDGLDPHDVVRAALTADLRWRDPESHATTRISLARHLLRRAREAPGPETAAAAAPAAARAADAFLHILLGRTEGPARRAARTGTSRLLEVGLAGPGAADAATVLHVAEADGGPGAAATTARSTSRRPEAFRVYRYGATGEVVGFSEWLRLTGPPEDEVGDPAVAQAWEHAQRHGAPRPGEHIAVSRFVVHPAARQHRAAVRELAESRALAEILRSPRLARTYFVLAPMIRLRATCPGRRAGSRARTGRARSWRTTHGPGRSRAGSRSATAPRRGRARRHPISSCSRSRSSTPRCVTRCGRRAAPASSRAIR